MADTLEVVRVWKTIQGEGPFTGCPAVFVRLAGCNLNCSWCDTDHQTGKWEQDVLWLAETTKKLLGKSRLIVVTGGEPFLQDGTISFLQALSMSARVQVETNGTLYPSGLLPRHVYVVCSPKPGHEIHPEWKYRINAWKYVVRAGCLARAGEGGVAGDGLPIGTTRPPAGALVYVQPMDEKNEEKNRANLEWAIKICLRMGYRLGVQLHKIIGVE